MRESAYCVLVLAVMAGLTGTALGDGNGTLGNSTLGNSTQGDGDDAQDWWNEQLVALTILGGVLSVVMPIFYRGFKSAHGWVIKKRAGWRKWQKQQRRQQKLRLKRERQKLQQKREKWELKRQKRELRLERQKWEFERQRRFDAKS